jgi:hypothetical protein
VRDESQPFLIPSQGPLFGDAGVEDAGEETDPSSRAGGLWVSCYARFAPSGQPLADVTRLGLLCGPPNGMRRLGDAFEGSVTPGGKPGTHSMHARKGACYRIFAIAEDSVRDLDVTVRSSRDSRLATDNTDDAWPIVEPERPFCTFADDTFTVELSSGAGAGRYAAEVWELRP